MIAWSCKRGITLFNPYRRCRCCVDVSYSAFVCRTVLGHYCLSACACAHVFLFRYCAIFTILSVSGKHVAYVWVYCALVGAEASHCANSTIWLVRRTFFHRHQKCLECRKYCICPLSRVLVFENILKGSIVGQFQTGLRSRWWCRSYIHVCRIQRTALDWKIPGRKIRSKNPGFS